MRSYGCGLPELYRKKYKNDRAVDRNIQKSHTMLIINGLAGCQDLINNMNCASSPAMPILIPSGSDYKAGKLFPGGAAHSSPGCAVIAVPLVEEIALASVHWAVCLHLASFVTTDVFCPHVHTYMFMNVLALRRELYSVCVMSTNFLHP